MVKILVIEDDDAVRSSILDLLEAKGYIGIEANNGATALNYLEKELPDLVISDIMMPQLDGFDLLKEFQKSEKTASIPFIFLSAKGDPCDIRAGMSNGADDYITKPFKVKDLLDSIESRLKKKKKFDEKIEQMCFNFSLYVPHELRTPLTALLGFTDLMIEEFPSLSPEDILDMLRKIKQSGNRLKRTIEKFLLYIEISMYVQNKNGYLLAVNNKLESADTFIMSAAIDKALSLSRLDDLKLDVKDAVLKINEQHLKFIVEELIENSAKFSASGTSIEIYGYKVNDSYCLRVKDCGKGMSPDQIHAIAPFVQHERQFLQQHGNGLGLIIIKRLTELYSCNFEIISEIKKYTEVYVSLPLYANEIIINSTNN